MYDFMIKYKIKELNVKMQSNQYVEQESINEKE